MTLQYARQPLTLIFSWKHRSIEKYQKSMKIWIVIFNCSPKGWVWSWQLHKQKNWRCKSSNYLGRKKFQSKVIKVDVTKASQTHAMKKSKQFKGFFFFLMSFPVSHGKTSTHTHPGKKNLLARILEVWTN